MGSNGNGHTDQLVEAAKRAIHRDQQASEMAQGLLSSLQGVPCIQNITGEVTNPETGEKYIKQVMMLPSGPFAVVFPLDFAEGIARNMLRIVERAKAGIEVVENVRGIIVP